MHSRLRIGYAHNCWDVPPNASGWIRLAAWRLQKNSCCCLFNTVDKPAAVRLAKWSHPTLQRFVVPHLDDSESLWKSRWKSPVETIHLKLLVGSSKVTLFWWFPIFPLQHPNVHISYLSLAVSPHLNLSATMIWPSNISSTPSCWCESTANFAFRAELAAYRAKFGGVQCNWGNTSTIFTQGPWVPWILAPSRYLLAIYIYKLYHPWS